MTLPEITLPKIDLPFDIPVLLHPSIDHFAIVLPVVVLLLEFFNLFAKRKSIGVFSFLLLVLTVIAFAAAYFTGVVDGKEAFDMLSKEGQDELKEHKVLGTYLLLASVALLLFKLLAMTGKKSLKILFFLLLLGFIAVTFQQGKDGGELVYEYGANVERVKILDDELFDMQDALEDAQAKKATEQLLEVQEQASKEKKIEEKAQELHSETTEEITPPQVNITTKSEPSEKSEASETKDTPLHNEKEREASATLIQSSTTTKEINSINEENATISIEQPTQSNKLVTPHGTEDTAQKSEITKQEVQKSNEIKIPKIPNVPQIQEANQQGKELQKFEDSFKDIASDLQKLKIKTH